MNPAIPWSSRLDAAARGRGSLPEALPLAGDGSDRRYYRLLGSPTVVLLFHPGSAGRGSE